MTFKSVEQKPLCSRLFPSDGAIPIRVKLLVAAQQGMDNNAYNNANNNVNANADGNANGNANAAQRQQQHPQPVQLSQSPSNRIIVSRRNVLPMKALCIYTVLLLLAIIGQILVGADGLTFYETDAQGKTTIVHDDSWQYCALVPAIIGDAANGNGSQFGLGPANDMLAVYNTAFGMNQEDYRILTVCILERYDFSTFMGIKNAPNLAVEFAFRCVCNYDLCNSEATFSPYLSTLKRESLDSSSRR